MAIADLYRQIGDLPTTIPVFPLRGAILLPGASLPLNIFEPRYLEMVGHVMSNERVLGIIQPAAADTSESPAGKAIALRHVGGVGRITTYQELEDGRFAIALTGISRFDMVEEIELNQAYRVARINCARFASDLTRNVGEEMVDRDMLLKSLRRYLEHKSLVTDWSMIESAPTEFLVNSLSVMSPYGSEEKQALLEAPDLKTRAALLVALSEISLASNGGNRGMLQ